MRKYIGVILISLLIIINFANNYCYATDNIRILEKYGETYNANNQDELNKKINNIEDESLTNLKQQITSNMEIDYVEIIINNGTRKADKKNTNYISDFGYESEWECLYTLKINNIVSYICKVKELETTEGWNSTTSREKVESVAINISGGESNFKSEKSNYDETKNDINEQLENYFKQNYLAQQMKLKSVFIDYASKNIDFANFIIKNGAVTDNKKLDQGKSYDHKVVYNGKRTYKYKLNNKNMYLYTEDYYTENMDDPVVTKCYFEIYTEREISKNDIKYVVCDDNKANDYWYLFNENKEYIGRYEHGNTINKFSIEWLYGKVNDVFGESLNLKEEYLNYRYPKYKDDNSGGYNIYIDSTSINNMVGNIKKYDTEINEYIFFMPIFEIRFIIDKSTSSIPNQYRGYNMTADEVVTPENVDGWYSDSNCTNKYDWKTKITGNINLYGKTIQKTSGGGEQPSGGQGPIGTDPKTEEPKVPDTGDYYILDPDKYTPTVDDSEAFKSRINIVIDVIRSIGIIIAVISLMGIGLKTMVGSVEEKAEFKKVLPGYIVGVILVVAITTLPTIIYNIVSSFNQL